MTSKRVIITGANSGIGKAASLKFANEGHVVIMACRNIEKSRPVQQEIIKNSNNSSVILKALDVSSFKSIKQFSYELNKEFDQIDILINNAAYFNHGSKYKLSEDGIEITFATNVVGPFLLTHLLKNLLSHSDDPRVLNAGSNIIKHFLNPKKEIDFTNLEGEDIQDPSYSVYINYRNSKMALLILTFRMADSFKPEGINVNSIQINGATMSKESLQKVKPGWRIIARIQNLFFRPPEYTADLYYKICTSSDYRHYSGIYYNHRAVPMQPAITDGGLLTDIKQALGSDVYPAYADQKEVSEQVWNRCREMTREYITLDA